MPTARVANVDLFYHDEDFADPWRDHDTVFMTHGFARNSNFWRAWVPSLAREYRVVRMDWRGHGSSGYPGPDYRFSLDDLVADVIGLLDSLELEHVHFIGESLGARVGLVLGAQHSERFKSLTLVSLPMWVAGPTQGAFAVGFPSWIEAMRTLGMKQWWLKSREAVHELSGNPAQDEHFANECARTPVEVAVALAEYVPSVNLVPLLPKIKAPTLILTPGVSSHTSKDEHAGVLKEIPQARQIVYEDANHGMYYLRPDRLAKDVLEFLRNGR